jgi:pimeloyl-ACP methyl ester carboxylesterase
VWRRSSAGIRLVDRRADRGWSIAARTGRCLLEWPDEGCSARSERRWADAYPASVRSIAAGRPEAENPGRGPSPDAHLRIGSGPVTHVLIVPGAAVRRYVLPAVQALESRGATAQLLAAPGEPGSPADLRVYGEELALRINHGPIVDLAVGLSVGAQAAAVAAAAAMTRVRHLMLVSPTVDPLARTTPKLLARWLAGGRLERPHLLREQAPDWRRAGPRRLSQLIRSALTVRIEDVLPVVSAELTVVHAENDVITSHPYAAGLAADHGGELLVVPNATHSWPYADADRFADTVEALLA